MGKRPFGAELRINGDDEEKCRSMRLCYINDSMTLLLRSKIILVQDACRIPE